MKLVLAVSLLSTAILIAALGYIFTHPVKRGLQLSAATNNFVWVPAIKEKFHFREMSKAERGQCPYTWVDRRKSMMRCVLPDDGSFVRSTQ